MKDKKVSAHNYSSNNSKLLKHLDTLKGIQDNTKFAPVMVHLSLTSNCNLNCSYCCYANRTKGESLSLDQLKSVIDQFSALGTKGIEFTGSGEPTLHPHLSEAIAYAKSKDCSVGLITNGTNPDAVKDYSLVDWMRVSSHVLSGHKSKLISRFEDTLSRGKSAGVDVGSVYIYSEQPFSDLERVVKFMDSHEVPTRVTPDLTKSKEWISENMSKVKDFIEGDLHSSHCFVTDFNIVYDRPNNHCYMKMVKPFVHTDGFVYVCPAASFSPENFCNVDEKYRFSSIEDITKTYEEMDNKPDLFDCGFCKYQTQNSLIDDLLRDTKHNDFA